ncbi:MAG: DALR domain-containing protein [Collinsella sp.]
MDDDFNTAGAIAAYFQLVTEANKYLEQAAGAVDGGAARVVRRRHQPVHSRSWASSSP